MKLAVPGVRWAVEGGFWPTTAGQSAAARGVLCRLVGEEAAVAHNAEGAPFLPARPGLHVSISHCSRAVAVAVSHKGPVGIDVECRRGVGEDLMRRVCSEDELSAVLASADSTMAFLQLWTRKEAVLKMRGTGIKGFGSLVGALAAGDAVADVPCGLPDVVCALAW